MREPNPIDAELDRREARLRARRGSATPTTVDAIAPDVLAAIEAAQSAARAADAPIDLAERRRARERVQVDGGPLRAERLRASGIAEYLSDRGHEALVTHRLVRTPALEEVHAWLRGETPWLGLFGPCDAGKTVAAGWALTRGDGGVYVKVRSIVQAFTADFGRPAREYEIACRSPLLVLDELGCEDDVGRARAALEDLLDRRQRRTRRTLILGNLSRRTLDERVGPRVMSRLQACGSLVGVEETGLRGRSR